MLKTIKYFVLFILLCSLGQVQAQNVEINPSIQWRFVKSQDMNLGSGNFYTFEFAAEKGFDYKFNLSHNQEGIVVKMSVYDLQDQPISVQEPRSTNVSADLDFDVPVHGTYKVLVGVTDPEAYKGKDIAVSFNLIRRQKI